MPFYEYNQVTTHNVKPEVSEQPFYYKLISYPIFKGLRCLICIFYEKFHCMLKLILQMKNNAFRCLLPILLVFSGLTSFAQGFLMLAGGAGESAGGWSDVPYRWVVEHAQNKRIAIITYDASATDWIPNYFKGFGARSAKNIIIASRSAANMQSVYDTLITYDGVFIKGGDQAKYYEYYKETKTQQALQYIYNNGGVLSGTSAGTAILSPIVYTAAVASVDPAVALTNAYSSQITLANDFLNTLPGQYIFDTHFAERGRFGRISSFMATWFKETNNMAIGIGVDDHTALCIDTSGKASVYGTGAVGFYFNTNPSSPYDTNGTMLRTKSMKFAQLTHGCTYDLKSGVITGLNAPIQPLVKEENTQAKLFFSGTDYPSDDAFTLFANQAGHVDDAIVIITGNDQVRANDVKLKLMAKGATEINIQQAIAANQNDEASRLIIEKAKKFFVIANDYSVFMSFINTMGNGHLLSERIRMPGMVSFFAGDNARFAGKTVITNYTGAGFASYHGTLGFLPGLGILKTTAIMPNTFINTDTYENTVSGLPYAMMSDSLEYGIYLTGNTVAAYDPGSGNNTFFKNNSGSYPLILLHNPGTLAGFANQGPYAASRNIAGFGSMNLKFLGVGDTVVAGNILPSSTHPVQSLKMNIYPNPARDSFHLQGLAGNYLLRITDMKGGVMTSETFAGSTDISLTSLAEGIYMIDILDLKSKNHFSTKLCVEK